MIATFAKKKKQERRLCALVCSSAVCYLRKKRRKNVRELNAREYKVSARIKKTKQRIVEISEDESNAEVKFTIVMKEEWWCQRTKKNRTEDIYKNNCNAIVTFRLQCVFLLFCNCRYTSEENCYNEWYGITKRTHMTLSIILGDKFSLIISTALKIKHAAHNTQVLRWSERKKIHLSILW